MGINIFGFIYHTVWLKKFFRFRFLNLGWVYKSNHNPKLKIFLGKNARIEKLYLEKNISKI